MSCMCFSTSIVVVYVRFWLNDKAQCAFISRCSVCTRACRPFLSLCNNKRDKGKHLYTIIKCAGTMHMTSQHIRHISYFKSLFTSILFVFIVIIINLQSRACVITGSQTFFCHVEKMYTGNITER